MSMLDKTIFFRGKNYKMTKVVEVIGKVTGDKHLQDWIEDEEDVSQVIDEIVKGDPSRCASFITLLSERDVK